MNDRRLDRPRIDVTTLPDGYQSAVRVWDVDQPAARVVFLHGIISHSGWYIQTGTELSRRGLEVHMPDRRGSGLCGDARGDVDAWPTWIGDVVDLLLRLPADRPRLLLGLSWGGMLAAAVARFAPRLVDGVGLICPGLFARQSPRAVKRIGVRIAAGTRARRRRVPIPLNDPTLFTDSPDYHSFIRDDPLTLRQITIRFAHENLAINRYATEFPAAIRVPLLLMLAGKDRIVRNEKVRAYFAATSSRRKTMLEYPNACHTLEFEDSTRAYYDDLAGWCIREAGRATNIRHD